VAYFRAKGSGFVVRWREGGFLSRRHSRFVQSRDEAEALRAELALPAQCSPHEVEDRRQRGFGR